MTATLAKPIATNDVLWTKTGMRGVWKAVALGGAAVLLLDHRDHGTVEVGVGTKGALQVLADTLDEAPVTLATWKDQLAAARMNRSSMPWLHYQRKVQGKRRAEIALQTSNALCSLHNVSGSGMTSDLDFVVGGEPFLAEPSDLRAVFADIDLVDAATSAAIRVIEVKLAREGTPYEKSL